MFTSPALLTHNHLTILLLSTLKVELTHDFPGALLRYGLSREVAQIILSLTIDEIQMLSEVSQRQNIVRVANPTSKAYWTDLKIALKQRDSTAVNLQLLQGLLQGTAMPARC